MGFFGLLFVLLLVVLLFGLSLLHGIIRLVVRILSGLFGGSKHYKDSAYQDPGAYSTRAGGRRTENPPSTRKKIFSADEGEYVDFEEIKDP